MGTIDARRSHALTRAGDSATGSGPTGRRRHAGVDARRCGPASGPWCLPNDRAIEAPRRSWVAPEEGDQVDPAQTRAIRIA